MKRLFTVLLLAFTAIAFNSCRETETKTIVKEVEVEKTETTEKEGILERVGNEVDKEVNEKIDKEIDKIGNDDA